MKRSNQIFLLTLFCCFTLLFLTGDAYADDVLQTVRNKAAKFINELRPLIFILAGFGLIGFAFGAIFGKLSWKWFANIAIGLFLVANVGLFIDYFATKSGAAGQYSQDLDYGKFLNKSGSYTPTEGSSSDPKSQNTPTGNNDGKTDNNSSEDLNNGCVPGTGTGCGTGTGKESGSETTGGADTTGAGGSGLPDELKNAPEMSADEIAAALGKSGSSQTTGNETTSGFDMASAAGGIGSIYDQMINEEDPDEAPLPGTGFENTQTNSREPSGSQMNALAQKAQEQYNSTGKIDMNQLLRDEVAAGRMTEEQAAQAGYIFTQAANSKGGNVGDAINDVLDSSKKQMEEDKATAEREAEYCKAKGGYWSNNRCMEIINEEDPDEAPLPGTGFESEAAACKAKGGYWSNNRCMEIINEENPDEAPLPGTGYENVYDVDGGELGEVVVTGKDYSKEKQSCTLKGGKWNSSKLSCEYDALNSPISIPNTNQNQNQNQNTSDMPSDEQMNALAQRAKEQYDSTGKIDMNQLLREEIAAGRMTEEQAAKAGYIFTDVANSKGGDVGDAIEEVLSGSKEQMEANKTAAENEAAACKAKGGYWSNNRCMEIINEETPDEEALPGTGFEQEAAACKAKGGYWSNNRCMDIINEETPDEEALPGTGFEQEAAACKAKGGYWSNNRCMEIINEEDPDEAPLPGTGWGYDVDGGELGEVVVTGKDYSKEKQSCTLKGGKWNSSKLTCEYDALNSPISIPSTNQNTSNMPSDAQMNALAQRAQEQYNSTGKINMNQLLREEIAAGRMTEEQAARAGYIFTDVANSNGGDVGDAIEEVLKGSKEQMETNKNAASNSNTSSQQNTVSNNNTAGQTVSSTKTEEDEGSGISQYGCKKMGGTWDAATGSCKGVKAPVSTSTDDDDDDTPSMVDEPDTPEDMAISFYGCNKKGGKWVNGECILP